MSGKRVEHRLAAILTADVAGYSRLMGEDEEGTLKRLGAIRSNLIDPKIAEHNGRIVKTTGDGGQSGTGTAASITTSGCVMKNCRHRIPPSESLVPHIIR